ncbi:1,6-anhydro-N-acetylmuramyl-L-alanine amidase AmpD [Marinobacterium weihaiense]|uniref:1,6-anhydro-N-acetylmuramyl-L-alanine amidase AmpD n=1 Tax=Marinobacterium weihaiense TaxID=2851016 RepID=A0ABS6M8U9_9GAMM|nr:1,6-anhydro-N-acetylmuramyl-L-alanine amidase AmpD [Marinobacterium weihaiense]MBV0932707.1 1,6-anhydro-N-acetylmuramyl-L-alanine amidase AmpD [Marinobacterium weihaiense]
MEQPEYAVGVHPLDQTPPVINQHRITSACFVPSPNCNTRPAGEISLLVIHNISLPPGQFGGGHVTELFTNCLDPQAHPFFAKLDGLEVSAHLLIERDGSMIQFVPFDRRAWHAGRSCFDGREACNDFSIGIELEGADDIPYTDAQYQVLAAVTRTLLVTYPNLTRDRITGHSNIAPGRKTDPGPAFDWARYRQSLG